MRKINYLIASTVLVTVSAPGLAGESLSMKGQIANQETGGVQPVGENYMVVTVANRGTVRLNDKSNPMHDATGQCAGSVLVDKGQPTGSGYCTYTDPSGDISIVTWSTKSINEKGGNAGTWQLVGGTGKYAKASGSGTYSSEPSADRTTSINSIDGSLEIQ